MAVVVHAHMNGDVERFKEILRTRADDFRAIGEEARQRGATHHRFLAGNGGVTIDDEWDSAENFQAFFSSQPKIRELVEQAGVQGPPQVSVFEKIESPDEF